MMQETGKVVEIRDDRTALVLCQKNSACQHCASVDACQMGHGSEERVVEALNGIGAAVGQRVRISVSSKTFLGSSFTVYILPLIALVACAMIGNALGQAFPETVDPELLSALFGVSGLVVALLIIRFRNRSLNREHYMPRIVAFDQSDDAPQEATDHGH